MFDRNKYKAASLDVIQGEEKKNLETEKVYSIGGGEGYTPVFRVEDGLNEFRIMPSCTEGVSPYMLMKTTILKCEVDKIDEKTHKPNGQKEIKGKRIFIATVHSDTMKKDPVELYLDYVFAQAEGMDVEAKKAYLAPVLGYRKSNTFIPGIRPTSCYVSYATNKKGELGRIELKTTWLKKMQEISTEKSEDDVATLDIFSDPDEGFPLLIKKELDANKTVYTVSTKDLPKGQTWEEFFEKYSVSDETLTKLEKCTSLKELYVNSYSRKDWEMALDGLQRFDKDNKYNVFANEKFLDELEALEKFVPQAKEVKEEKSSVNIEKQGQSEASQSKPTISKMKRYLKVFLDDEYGTELPESLSDAEIEEWYDLAVNDQPLPIKPTTTTNPTEDASDDVATGEEEDSADAALAKIRQLRNKRG